MEPDGGRGKREPLGTGVPGGGGALGPGRFCDDGMWLPLTKDRGPSAGGEHSESAAAQP